jgi:hypothetical protein
MQIWISLFFQDPLEVAIIVGLFYDNLSGDYKEMSSILADQ